MTFVPNTDSVIMNENGFKLGVSKHKHDAADAALHSKIISIRYLIHDSLLHGTKHIIFA